MYGVGLQDTNDSAASFIMELQREDHSSVMDCQSVAFDILSFVLFCNRSRHLLLQVLLSCRIFACPDIKTLLWPLLANRRTKHELKFGHDKSMIRPAFCTSHDTC